MTEHNVPETAVRTNLVKALFEQISGKWVLNRRLQSTNISEPAGLCTGTATFTPREPSVFINADGKLELATAEMVYHEQGHFDMQSTSSQANAMRFPFSRKYVWRIQKEDDGLAPLLSIWFTKPGTETIDYLFHKVSVTISEADGGDAEQMGACIQGDGCHLCEEDLYSSTYTFDIGSQQHPSDQQSEPFQLRSWKMLHEVRGPGKDQHIETHFTRD